MTSDKKS